MVVFKLQGGDQSVTEGSLKKNVWDSEFQFPWKLFKSGQTVPQFFTAHTCSTQGSWPSQRQAKGKGKCPSYFHSMVTWAKGWKECSQFSLHPHPLLQGFLQGGGTAVNTHQAVAWSLVKAVFKAKCCEPDGMFLWRFSHRHVTLDVENKWRPLMPWNTAERGTTGRLTFKKLADLRKTEGIEDCTIYSPHIVIKMGSASPVNLLNTQETQV